jgi:hypothetical protein
MLLFFHSHTAIWSDMKFVLHPWQLFTPDPRRLDRREQDVIEYLRVENRVLREKLGKKRILPPGVGIRLLDTLPKMESFRK